MIDDAQQPAEDESRKSREVIQGGKPGKNRENVFLSGHSGL